MKYEGLDDAIINNGTIFINKADSSMTIDNVVLDYGESKNVTATTEGATGITAKINGTDAIINEFTILISGLVAGNYTLEVTTIPDENHIAVTRESNVIVNKIKTEISANDVTTIYNVNKDLEISLKDINGNPISGASITVDLVGEKSYTTDENGQVKVATKDLDAGDHIAKIVFETTDIYRKSNTSAKLTINKIASNLTPNNLTTIYNVEDYLIATLRDGDGNPISGAELSVYLDEKVEYTTDENGQIKVPTKDLSPYKYNALIIYEGDTNHIGSSERAKVTVSRIGTKIVFKNMNTTAIDYKIDGRIGKYFKFKLIDEYGNPIAGKLIYIGFNGVKYNRTTDEKGSARLQINLRIVNLYTFAIGFTGMMGIWNHLKLL